MLQWENEMLDSRLSVLIHLKIKKMGINALDSHFKKSKIIC
jgi:hypothetical protein